MKKIFTLFAALAMVMSMSAATTRIYCKNTQSWWKADGAAVGAYYWGTGGNANAWPGTRMTKVSGETDLWYIDIDVSKYQNIIFTRVNGSGTVSDWGTKTGDLTIPTNGNNLFTITTTSASWGGGVKGTWSKYVTTVTVTIQAENGPVTGLATGGTYDSGSTATLTAVPNDGYEFVNWTVGGKEVSTANPYTFTVNDNITLVANFKEAAAKSYTITTSATNGTVEGAATVVEGESVTLTATANPGYKFLNWTVGGVEVSTDNPYTFVPTEDATVVANFEQLPPETVYFVNAADWTGTINIHAWGGTASGTAWPGNPAHKEDYQIGGHDVYSLTAAAGAYANVIFNNKVGDAGNQTADLEWTAGKYYVVDEWLTKEEAEEKLASGEPLGLTYNVTVPAGTNACYIAGEMNGWSQQEMTKVDDTHYTITIVGATTAMKYKYCSGPAWDYEELNADGSPVADRTHSENDVVAKWKKVYNPNPTVDPEPDPTYDYYVVGTFNSWANPDPDHGMTLVGDVYKATVTLNVGANMLKVTNGTWDNAKGFDAMGAEYEEVSNDTEDGNILITLTEGKDVVVVYNATTGKVTFEGLTEKLPAVITYVLMGVNNDWTTGISLVRNEENTEYEEYMLLGQEILAGDAVKVVTLTDGVATAWCGNVDVQSIELLGVTFDENGNVVLAPGKYDFYYKVADNGIYIAGEAYPVVEPELPAASVRAWAYDLALAVEGEQYTFSYKATTAALATLIFTDGEGVELATVELGLVEAGANSVVLAKSELPVGKKVNWAVKLEAGAIAAFTEVTDDSKGIYNFYLPQGVAVDNNPESATFGNIYVAQPTDGLSDGGTTRAKNQKQGIFVYDQTLAELNTTNVGIVPSNVTLASTASRQVMKRIAINPVTNEVAFAHNAAPVAVWAVPAENVGGEAKNLIEGLGFEAVNAICFDEEGALYVLVSTGYPNPGSLYKVVDGQVTTLFADYGKFGNADVALASDGRGGVWIAQNRGQLDTFNQLTHVNAAGEIDFELNSTTPYGFENMSTARGTLAYNYNEDILAIGIGASGTIGASLYQVTYDETTGVPALTFIAATPSMGKNVDGLAFDYAGDLYGLSANKERFYKYAVPTESNVCTTPAASKYAFQNIEYDTMEITMTNLEVAEMDGYLVLTASDEMETGLNVMLALNEDGSVSEMSYAAISSGWMETELPIVGGNITKTYSEELATDVYSGLVVVENMGGYLGLQLTMYYVAPEYTDIVITNAIVTEDVRDLGWGDATYTVLTLESTWSDGVETYPVLVEVSDYDLSVSEGTMVVSVTIGDNETYTPWLGWAEGEMAYTIADDVITLTGKVENISNSIYWNLIISGALPKQDVPTALGNIDSSVTPVKMIKNGQVIIIKNGVQYSVQGQVIK